MASHPSSVRVQLLNDEWWWKERDTGVDHEHTVLAELEVSHNQSEADVIGREDIKNKWQAATASPSEVHIELLKKSVIPHPYIGFNEHDVQWVGETEWLYYCNFAFDLQTAGGGFALLTFEGLDTLCDVYLNGSKIIEANNMFREYTFEMPLSASGLKPLLKETNTLLLHFKSAKLAAKNEEKIRGKVRAGSTNLGDPSRVYVRKAQYDWRWDWGPELMTCGPYRPITLTTYLIKIKDVHAKAALDNLKPTLSVDVVLSGVVESHAHMLEILLKSNETSLVLKSRRVPLATTAIVDGVLSLDNVVTWTDLQGVGVEPWWPVGWGKQMLYTLETKILGPDDGVLDSRVKRIGFRNVELVQEALDTPDRYGTGTTFFFKVNGERMFIGGSNWIPADNFLTTITEERYRAWLTLLRDGNQNMVRIWGGGVYEPDIFYDICDELGILVWQDFQFACGVYPAHDAFVDSVKKEAEYNVKRLRHHPSIAIFCGNNEDYQLVLQWGDVPYLPARVLYEEVLPEVVATHTNPHIPYHRGSPYGGKGWDTSDPTVGDVHQWNVWGGKELPYQDYHKLGGRFVSEFGVPSMPCMKTINYWLSGSDDSQHHAQSKLMAQHTRAGSFERRFAICMNENFRLTEDLETHAFNTQVMQSEAVSYAYQVWRREWRGKSKEYCGGVLVWQFNDCWPGTSWALVDYFLRPKPVYYTIARQLATYTINIFREVVQDRDNDRPQQFYEFGATLSRYALLHIWVTNNSNTTREAILDLQYFDLDSAWTERDSSLGGSTPSSPAASTDSHTGRSRTLILLPNQSQEVATVRCPAPPNRLSDTVIISARLLDPKTGEVFARCADWPQPYRFLRFSSPSLKIQVEEMSNLNETKFTISADKPVKCLFLSADADDFQDEVRWSDNALDLVPGDEQVVVARGLRDRAIQVSYLGQDLKIKK